MKAVLINSHGSIDVLKYCEIKEPVCTKNKIKVNIKASALNHLDIWVREGIPGLKIPLPMILGSDGAGIITEIGSNVKSSFAIGDKVVIQPGTYSSDCPHVKNKQENFSRTYGILGETENGVQCNYIVVNPENLYPMASNLSFEEASSMQLVFMTAYQMLVKRAFLQSSEMVLIYGGTSGVGTAAIQIAKDIGATIIATVGSTAKFDHADYHGADYVVNHSEKDWFSQIQKILNKNKANVIFEHIGLYTWDFSMRLLANGGRLVTCGATTGHNVNIDLRHLFTKQQSIIGSTMSDIDTFNQVQRKINKNIYTPFVDKIYPVSDIKKAHKRIEDREHLGKVVISL